MRVRNRAAALLLAAAALSTAEPYAAEAQHIPSPYRHIEPAQSLSLYSGYLSTSRGDVGIGLASGPTIGLRYAGRIAAPVAGIARLSMTPSERTIFGRENVNDPASPLTELGEVSATIVAAEAGLRLLLTGPRTWHALAPYIEATGALVSVSGSRTEEERELPTNQVVDFGPSFAVGVGTGTDWFLTDRLSINLGLQGLLWRLSIPEGLSSTGREDSEWTRNYGVTVGAAYHF
ncbi:MAG TPA: hypothetical protein VF167_03755 [Longimicrobiaceae bacterium]